MGQTKLRLPENAHRLLLFLSAKNKIIIFLFWDSYESEWPSMLINEAEDSLSIA